MEIAEHIGSYRIVRLLGQGGMGSVYEVEHLQLGVRYALKVFTSGQAADEFLRKRFLTEGKLLARLDHPRLVRVFDLGVDARLGQPYFVMNLVLSPDGTPQTLENLRRDGLIDEEKAAVWYDDLVEALRFVHASGVVHRDVKLENVLIDGEGRAVLSDFGVSRIFDEELRDDLLTTVTMVGNADKLIMGTKVYLAPEIRFGEKATPVSDWYAFGVLMLRLLTGVWYGPESDVEGLLSGFDPIWTTRLKSLLAIDPKQRSPQPHAERSDAVCLPGTDAKPSVLDGRKRWPIRRVAVAVCVLLCGLVLVRAGRRADRVQEGAVETVSLDETVPDGVPGIPPFLYRGRAIRTLRFPDSVTQIGQAACLNCALVAVDMPRVQVIGPKAFMGCTNLVSVVLPASLSRLGRSAFADCRRLETVEFLGRPPRLVGGGKTVFPTGVVGYYPAAFAEKWRAVIDADGRWQGLDMRCRSGRSDNTGRSDF